MISIPCGDLDVSFKCCCLPCKQTFNFVVSAAVYFQISTTNDFKPADLPTVWFGKLQSTLGNLEREEYRRDQYGESKRFVWCHFMSIKTMLIP